MERKEGGQKEMEIYEQNVVLHLVLDALRIILYAPLTSFSILLSSFARPRRCDRFGECADQNYYRHDCSLQHKHDNDNDVED